MTLEERFDRIEALLMTLVNREQIKDHYEVSEFAEKVERAPFTVRAWCRDGRIHADKKFSGRGAHPQWVISHAELLRYQKEGLLEGRK
jgi:hypothetical protein